MVKNKNVRLGIILVCIALSLVALWPTFKFYGLSNDDKAKMRESAEGTKELNDLQGKSINLGLDLKGGIHLVLEADVVTLFENLVKTKDNEFVRIFEKAAAEYRTDQESNFAGVLENHFSEAGLPMINYWGEKHKDDAGVVRFLNDEAKDAVDRAQSIIRNRVDQFGVSEPTIQKQGDHRIIVELPGIDDPVIAKNLIQQTALLEFKLLRDPQDAGNIFERLDTYFARIDTLNAQKMTTDSITNAAKDTAKLSGLSAELLKPESDTATTDTAAVQSGNKPFTQYIIGQQIGQTGYDFYVAAQNLEFVKSLLFMKVGDRTKIKPGVQAAIGESNEILFSNKEVHEGFYAAYVVKKAAELSGAVVTEAKQDIYQGMDPGMAGRPIVTLKMTPDGSKRWAVVTGANINKRIAVVLDDKVQSAPNIIEKISGGNTQITGMDNMEEAKSLAIALRAGSLPAPVHIIEERTIGPSLGADSIDSGKLAFWVAFIVVAIAMIVYYRNSGGVADMALVLNVLFLMGILTGFGFTLTLPGIAGMILTMGMAVDANVLIYERIREEIRLGKTVRASIETGFSKAFVTILDANLTTFGTGLVLFQFGTGPIKGFALTLMIGIITTIFCGVFVTRVLMDLIYDRATTEQRISIGVDYDRIATQKV
ncbi:protein translocase subunit SecD [bacterium]|nr:protein translocase subunit SecD [bacterium]